MSTYDMILLEGEKKGEKKGRKEAIKTTVIRMLRKFPKWSNEEIAELTGASIDFVEKIRNGLKK